jgi:hypothetical protein
MLSKRTLRHDNFGLKYSIIGVQNIRPKQNYMDYKIYI